MFTVCVLPHSRSYQVLFVHLIWGHILSLQEPTNNMRKTAETCLSIFFISAPRLNVVWLHARDVLKLELIIKAILRGRFPGSDARSAPKNTTCRWKELTRKICHSIFWLEKHNQAEHFSLELSRHVRFVDRKSPVGCRERGKKTRPFCCVLLRFTFLEGNKDFSFN